MKIVTKILMAFMLVSIMFVTTGCQTKVVPPGTVVIVLKSDGTSKIHTEGSYLAWGRDRVYFVDTKLKSYTERMEILCADNINMTVDVKWVGSFNANKNNVKIIKEKVPAIPSKGGDISGYQLSLDQFYKTAMKDIIRANARAVVADYTTDNVRESRNKIQGEVRARVLKRFSELKFPVSSTDIMISNLDYPDEITAQRKAIKNAQLEDEKQAALAKAAIEQAKRQAGIAREKGKAQIERAKADAMANDIRAKSLTPEIIQMRQWDVLESLAGNGNMMIVPYEALGQSADAALIKGAMGIK